MGSRFWLVAYIEPLFDSQFSLIYFSRLKYILAHQISILASKIHHNACKSDNNDVIIIHQYGWETKKYISTSDEATLNLAFILMHNIKGSFWKQKEC